MSNKPLNLNLEILNWRKQNLGMLKAYFTVKFKKEHMEIHDFTYWKKDGKCWVSYPSKPWTDKEGRIVRDAEGKAKYSPIVSFYDEGHYKFQADIIQLIEFQLWETNEAAHFKPLNSPVVNTDPTDGMF